MLPRLWVPLVAVSLAPDVAVAGAVCAAVAFAADVAVAVAGAGFDADADADAAAPIACHLAAPAVADVVAVCALLGAGVSTLTPLPLLRAAAL